MQHDRSLVENLQVLKDMSNDVMIPPKTCNFDFLDDPFEQDLYLKQRKQSNSFNVGRSRQGTDNFDII